MISLFVHGQEHERYQQDDIGVDIKARTASRLGEHHEMEHDHSEFGGVDDKHNTMKRKVVAIENEHAGGHLAEEERDDDKRRIDFVLDGVNRRDHRAAQRLPTSDQAAKMSPRRVAGQGKQNLRHNVARRHSSNGDRRMQIEEYRDAVERARRKMPTRLFGAAALQGFKPSLSDVVDDADRKLDIIVANELLPRPTAYVDNSGRERSATREGRVGEGVRKLIAHATMQDARDVKLDEYTTKQLFQIQLGEVRHGERVEFKDRLIYY